jgi:hypothetical protein
MLSTMVAQRCGTRDPRLLFLASACRPLRCRLLAASVCSPGARRNDRAAAASLVQPLTGRFPALGYDRAGLHRSFAIESALLALLLIGLLTASAAHVSHTHLLTGAWAWPFWGLVVGVGIIVPFTLQALELKHRIPHTVIPALLVLAGGFALRWILVNAGQASELFSAAAGL